MATKTATKEYGFLIAPVGKMDDSGGKFVSKETFLRQLELAYPYGEGWRVVDRNVENGAGDAVLVAYHVERDDLV